jgi:arylsulfatase A-like enzyme
MHGRDLKPLLENPESRGPVLPCFYEHTGKSYGSDVAKVLKEKPEEAVHSHVPWYVALNDGRWKYIRYLNNREEELYDLQADPEELINLREARPAELERLRGVMQAELRRTGATEL